MPIFYKIISTITQTIKPTPFKLIAVFVILLFLALLLFIFQNFVCYVSGGTLMESSFTYHCGPIGHFFWTEPKPNETFDWGISSLVYFPRRRNTPYLFIPIVMFIWAVIVEWKRIKKPIEHKRRLSWIAAVYIIGIIYGLLVLDTILHW